MARSSSSDILSDEVSHEITKTGSLLQGDIHVPLQLTSINSGLMMHGMY